MTVGKLGGIPIRLHWTMLLLLTFYCGMGLQRQVWLLLGALLLHELAHAAAAGLLGVKVTEVVLFPFGGQAKIEEIMAAQPGKEVGVALAGPGMSFLLAGLFSWSGLPVAVQPAAQFARLNWLLLAFNLLPVLPLDGGRVLRALAGLLLGYRRATRITAGLGEALGGGLFCGGVYALFSGGGCNLMLAGAVLFWTAHREHQFFSYHFMRLLLHQKEQLARQGVLPVKMVVCKRRCGVRRVLEEIRPRQYLLVTLVDEEHRVTGSRSETQLIRAFLEQGTGIALQDVR